MRRFCLRYYFIFCLVLTAQASFVLPQFFATSTNLSSETEVPEAESSADTNLLPQAFLRKNSNQNRFSQKYDRRYIKNSSFSGLHFNSLIGEDLFRITVHPDTLRTLPLLI